MSFIVIVTASLGHEPSRGAAARRRPPPSSPPPQAAIPSARAGDEHVTVACAYARPRSPSSAALTSSRSGRALTARRCRAAADRRRSRTCRVVDVAASPRARPSQPGASRFESPPNTSARAERARSSAAASPRASASRARRGSACVQTFTTQPDSPGATPCITRRSGRPRQLVRRVLPIGVRAQDRVAAAAVRRDQLRLRAAIARRTGRSRSCASSAPSRARPSSRPGPPATTAAPPAVAPTSHAQPGLRHANSESSERHTGGFARPWNRFQVQDESRESIKRGSASARDRPFRTHQLIFARQQEECRRSPEGVCIRYSHFKHPGSPQHRAISAARDFFFFFFFFFFCA